MGWCGLAVSMASGGGLLGALLCHCTTYNAEASVSRPIGKLSTARLTTQWHVSPLQTQISQHRSTSAQELHSHQGM